MKVRCGSRARVRETAAWIGLALMLALDAAHHAAAADPAVIHVEYDPAADERCASAGHYRIDRGWIAELQGVVSALDSTWGSIAPTMLQAVTQLTGKPVEPVPRRVRLTLCDSPSQAFLEPSVNMRYALRSFTSAPVPMRYKLDTAFHELLHPLVSRHTPAKSPLLALHRAESACVRNHLHLLALQKAVLLAVGERDALAQVVAIDSELPSGCYRRAWSIVNEAEDAHRRYIEELADR